MAQATVTDISDWVRKPVLADPKAMFAAAFQGMEGDITDLLSMARLEALAINHLMDGFEVGTDGERYCVVRADAAATIQYASSELFAMIERLSISYHNVFRLVHSETPKT